MRTGALFAILVACAALAQDVPAQPAWDSLKIGQTSAERAVYLFGVPDYVRIDLDWRQFTARQQKPRRYEQYSFMYFPIRGELAIFRGPLGYASSAELGFENDKLFSSQWTYRGPRLQSAYNAWIADKSQELGVAGKLLISSKRVLGSLMFVSCPLGDKPLQCLDEITVMISQEPPSK
ncbi:MAG: hypothetical protein AABO58_25975 [Acidobacteriota bacterium]